MAIETMRTWKIGEVDITRMRTAEHQIMLDTCIGADRDREFDVFVIGSHFSDPTGGWVVRDTDGCRLELKPAAKD